MCNFKVLVIFLCSVLIVSIDCASLSYDQRQTGDLNVQIGLKNIQLIALLKAGTEEYVDYDYAYDYSEMTIKPQHGTTSKPLNITNSQMPNNGTTEKIPLLESTTPDVITSDQHNNDTGLSSNTTAVNITFGSNLNVTIDPATEINNQTTDKLDSPQNNSSVTNTVKAARAEGTSTVLPDTLGSSPLPVTPSNCRRGFFLNNQGKCEYKVQGTSNALRRIVKLAQKIKVGRGVKET